MFCAVSEETDRVISERRLESLRQLALALAGAQGHEAVLDAVEAELARNDRDMPFALVYLLDETGASVLARNCAGMDPDHPCAHAAGAAEDPWGVRFGLVRVPAGYRFVVTVLAGLGVRRKKLARRPPHHGLAGAVDHQIPACLHVLDE